jgi:hypothetical protein
MPGWRRTSRRWLDRTNHDWIVLGVLAAVVIGLFAALAVEAFWGNY